MDGFTPTFFLQLIVALGSGFGAYVAIRKDLSNTMERLNKEVELREQLGKETDQSIHDVRGEIATVALKVAMIEGGKR